MKIYRCKKQFLCNPLKQYIPVGALVARYENITKIVVQNAPRTDVDYSSVLVDGLVYQDPNMVTWIYTMEPPPLGTNTKFFEVIGQAAEDAYGNGSATPGGRWCAR